MTEDDLSVVLEPGKITRVQNSVGNWQVTIKVHEIATERNDIMLAFVCGIFVGGFIGVAIMCIVRHEKSEYTEEEDVGTE